MKTQISNLITRGGVLENEVNLFRGDALALIEEAAKKGPINVPVNAGFVKRSDLSDYDKQYNSVMMDSYPVRFLYQEDERIHYGYVMSLYYDTESRYVMARVYDGTLDEKKRSIELTTPVDAIQDVIPLLRYVQAFYKDPDEPELN